MNNRRKYYNPLPRYTFKAEDDWGDYDKGKYRSGHKIKGGYIVHWYVCDDGKGHNISEHSKKWEYFNGKIPEGYEVDHIIPISNGGTNKLSNLRLVTPKENSNNPNTRRNMSNALKGKYVGDKNPMYGKKQSKETIKKRVIQFRGENHYLYGKHPSESSIEKNRLAHIGKEYPSRRKPIVQIDKDGIVKEWECAFETKAYGFNYKSVSSCCNGNYNRIGNHTYKGYEWYFKSDYEKMLTEQAC